MAVGQLVLLFMEHAQGYYVKNGKPTSEVHCFRAAIRPLARLFRHRQCREFGPQKLRAVRDAIVASGCCRSTVNRSVRRIIKVFRWAGDEIRGTVVLASPETVEPLRAGRTKAREMPPVLPVPVDVLEQTLPHLPAAARVAVPSQLATGMRPAEVVTLRVGDLSRTGAIGNTACATTRLSIMAETADRLHRSSRTGRSEVLADR